ncbi:MAG TPA: spore maturation protein A [Firmicutes bacterium]|nr:spore maturation protein A [Bacillota bacterium]
MAMAWIFTAMVAVSVLFGIYNGTMDAVSAAALSGANDAVTLCVGLLGVICLWSGVLEIMDRSGLSQILAAAFRPLLRKLFPDAAGDPVTLSAISANISANLLGIGNAATPLGIQAAKRMAKGCSGTASDSLCRFIVLNTASIQLIPATVAGVRAACGAAEPFDILPAVWFASVLSVAAGLLAARVLQCLWRPGP